jgi:pimeloyl-ACP methyl ester carboxylesterase
MRNLLWIALAICAGGLNPPRADSPDGVLDKAPSKFAKSGDLKVHYKTLLAEQDESAPALVFIHGWCCDLTVWRDQAKAFDGKLRMLFIDLPGYGKSDNPRIDYTMDVFAKGIDAVLQDAGVQQAILAGHSMGTPAVRQFYRLFPAKTKGLIFVDGGLRPFIKDPAEIEKFMSMFKEETFRQDAPKFLMGMLPPTTPQAMRQHIEGMVTNTSPQVAISSMRSMMDEKLWKEDPIKVPAQALMAKSPFWTPEYKEFVKQLMPDLDYREFEGVSHFLFMDKPKEFNDAMAEFLKKQGLLK